MKKGLSLPTSFEFAIKRIKKQEEQLEAISDALHSLSNECAVLLNNKDKDFEDKCMACRRSRL